MSLSKINQVTTLPDIRSLTPNQVIEQLVNVVHNTRVLLMQVNNEVIDLKRKVDELKRNQGLQ